jgi:hypothetical protein
MDKTKHPTDDVNTVLVALCHRIGFQLDWILFIETTTGATD